MRGQWTMCSLIRKISERIIWMQCSVIHVTQLIRTKVEDEEMPVNKLQTVLGSYGQNLATTQQINKTLKEWQNVGYMARVNYNYANKYYLTANFPP